MITLNAKKCKFESIFSNDSAPRLLSICYQNHNIAKFPRMMHKHDDRMEILFVQKGNGSYLVEGEKYTTGKGDILVYNSGVLHDECHVNNISNHDIIIYSCSISGVKINKLPANHLVAAGQDILIKSGDYAIDIETMFELILRQVKINSKNSELIDYLTKALILLIYNLSQNNFNRTNHTINHVLGTRIQNYLDENYNKDIKLENIAHALNVNKFYLSHIFKTFSGYSPVQYLIRRRIGEAQTLLINSQYRVTDIAYIVGYNNMSNFQQTFVKIVGMTPHKYRCLMLDKERNDYIIIN
ncbi:hypothetical protein A9G12_10180 [Gilliamella sp. wkB112]|nr:hypothetical protein A9G12_10180 [Gilliamella apicola]